MSLSYVLNGKRSNNLDDLIFIFIEFRNYIVQTEEQYIFIYEAINEAIQSGQTEVPARNLLTHLQRLLQPINDSSLTEMELEFKVKNERFRRVLCIHDFFHSVWPMSKLNHRNF